MSRDPTQPLHVGVLFGDPRLPYPYRPEDRLSEEDFEDIRRLREALAPLDGFRFSYFDDHLRLYEDLREAAPDLVLNLCDTGYRNVVHHDTLVAALLEILDIPFTGAGSFSMGLSTDKSMVRALAMGIGIPVPNETFVDLTADPPVLPELYPALIKPNAADGSVGITRDCVVHNDAEALAYLEWLRDQLDRPQALIQDFLTGTEYTVGLIGNPGDFTVLPPLEIDYSHLDPGLPPILSYGSKADPDSAYWQELAFRRADIDDVTYAQLVDHTVRLFQRLGCRDYARFDFRAGIDGVPRLLDANYNPTWSWNGKLALMASWAGSRGGCSITRPDAQAPQNLLRSLPMALAELISGRSVPGDQPAVLAFGRDSARTTSRDELFDCAGRLAAGLEKAGLERGDRVVLMAPNSADWIVSALGVMHAGGGGAAGRPDARRGSGARPGRLRPGLPLHHHRALGAHRCPGPGSECAGPPVRG